jgi:hypothetical protein
MMRISIPATSGLQRVRKKIARRTFEFQKELFQFTRKHTTETQQLLLIIGCQRSGTTLMSETLGKDWNAKIYPEHSNLSSGDEVDQLRLNPLTVVARTLDRERFPLVVLKPLVETQNADRLLEFFHQARAIWMYRHYKDVAASNLKRFGSGNGIKNLRYIVQDDAKNWRSERVPPDVRELIKTYFSETMNPYDAAALFWYVRNRYYFDLGLDKHPRVMKCQYSDFVTSPGQTIQAVYRFVDRPYPGDGILSEIHSTSIGKGRVVELSPEIDNLCNELWLRLNRGDTMTGKAGPFL